MNTEQQVAYFKKVKKTLKDNGRNIAWILERTYISRGHWYFLKEGLRPLTKDNKLAIDNALDYARETA